MSILLAQLRATMRQHPWVTACLVVAVLAGAANYPLWQRRQRIIREHETVRRQGETMLDALADRIRINADLATVREAQDIVDRNLVSEDTMEVNLGYFYRLEKVNRVRLQRIDQMAAAPVSPGAQFKTVPVSLQLTGTYRNTLAFMRDLETGPRILRLRSYRLERQDPTGTDLVASLSVDLLASP